MHGIFYYCINWHLLGHGQEATITRFFWQAILIILHPIEVDRFYGRCKIRIPYFNRPDGEKRKFLLTFIPFIFSSCVIDMHIS
jgi:hypothetical protein